MATIIRSDLTISGTYKLTENTQLAPGVKITVLPGATLDLGHFTLLNFGTLSLEGSATAFAVVQNGSYSTDATSGALVSNYGNLKEVYADGAYDNGTITLNNSLLELSAVEAFSSYTISNSLFITSPLFLNTKPATIDKTTFVDSPVSLQAWLNLPANNVKITDSNFVASGKAGYGSDPVIRLDPFFSGSGMAFGVNISGSYVRIPAGKNFEDMVYDATDDLHVSKDLLASDFLTSPVTNSPSGFKVGSYTLSTNALLSGVVGNSTPVTGTELHTLSVVVDKGVLGPDAVLLKGLSEKMTLTDGVVTGHTVTYGATTFDYAQIDALIMTVTRDGNFTDEFRQEIATRRPRPRP
jgi:hypothetical protein